MAVLALALALMASLTPLAISVTIPTPSSISSDITLLYYNDLDCESSLIHFVASVDAV